MNPAMHEFDQRKILSEVALGNIPLDSLVVNGTAFNVFTREFIPKQSIWIKDGRIAYVGPDHDPLRDEKTEVIDADGMVVLPGLIDGHSHLSSAKCGVEEFVKHVIPTGTTTVVTETIDLASILGLDGLKYWVDGFERQPLRVLYTVPPLSGLTLAEERCALSAQELLPFLKDPNCLGLGEVYWSNLFLEGIQAERVIEIASAAFDLGKSIEGHTAGASGRKLQAFSCFGASSCHEPITEQEIMDRLRLGYWVMIREGSIRRELQGVKAIFRRDIDFRRVTVCTDGVDPIDLLQDGYLDASLRTLLLLGVPPQLAYQMVTINVAEHFRLDDLIGSLSPGRMADLVIVPRPEEFSPQVVMFAGKVIYRDGKSLVEPRRVSFSDSMLHTVRVENFSFPPIPKHGKVRVIDLVSTLVTKEGIVDLDNPEESEDVIMALAIDRIGDGKPFMGYLRGYGLKRGAIASTLCWDTWDMVVLGCDTESMTTALERAKELSGGAVYAIGKEIVAELPAPLCGYLSLEPMEVLRDQQKGLEETLRKNGVKWEKPTLTVDTLTTVAIPHIRLTHNGYILLKDRRVLSTAV